MKIDYSLTEEDYLEFNLFHAKNSEAVSKSLMLQRFLSPIVFIIAAFTFSWVGDISLLASLIGFSFISILWIVYYPKYFYYLLMKNSKKLLKEGKNDGLIGERYMTLSEQGIIDVSSNGETKVNWAGIKSIQEDTNHYYLYNSAVSAYIIPKRALQNLEETRSYLKSKQVNYF
ncbi:YcxB family protein [Sporosarcina sp. G11-34]|uniref:YcxB family protein n=1 Tax=Sporosarcina sp. G11-34 TaxID=2849605 RepID=UPI0022A9951B|nr:YcxB family protein [Sporosarcina sp. G11-34]MCZ2256932.1 YcxB family protein [Sporosarcina sp. G11-34]